MKTNRAGIDLLKRWEGCRLTAYPDPATGGEPYTVGYGLTSAAGIIKVYPGLRITQAQADEYLVAALRKYERAVSDALKRTPNENQFGALCSLCYNIGPGAFAKSSVVRLFNAGKVADAADAFRMWNRGGGKVMAGLVSRREDERRLFLTPVSDAPGEPVAPRPLPPDVPMPDEVETRPTGLLAWLAGYFKRKDN